jgi:hypothetical protein
MGGTELTNCYTCTLSTIMGGTELTNCYTCTLSHSMCGTELTHCITFHTIVGGRELTTFQHIDLNRVYIGLGCAKLSNFITLCCVVYIVSRALRSAQRLVVVAF